MRLIRVAMVAVFAFAFGNAYAFHSGGVAECEGCHTMHNSKENKPMEAEGIGASIGVALGLTQFQAGPYLLKASDQSSACLNCHNAKDTAPSSYHISTDSSLLAPGVPPVEMTPGGDFAWLKKTYNTTIRSTTTINGNEGDRHGHNINATDYGYEMDQVQLVSPGGAYPRENLHCSSCHDPHGKYRRFSDNTVGTTGLPIFNSGSYQNSVAPTANVSAVGMYRLLGGIGYLPKSVSNAALAFTNPSPVAVVNSTYNRSEGTTQTHVAYGSGMAEWCGNCHPNMHLDTYVSGTPKLVHPAGNGAKLTGAIVANYNAYVSSGIMTNSDPLKAYSSLAPFEEGVDYSGIPALKLLAVNDDSASSPATTGKNVMCLSCHRANASGFESMTRFFLENEFMTIADASNNAIYDPSTTENKINWGYSQAEQQAAYYGRPATVFGPYARNYCNKCHAKD